MRKKLITIIICVLSTVIIILLPFFVEYILLNESTFPFNLPISFSKEVWFSFIASYLGAIGTIFLGIIALYQNKKYKELSDETESKFISLHEEIKLLTQKNVALIELNSKLEKAKYHPILSDLYFYTWNIRGKHLQKDFDLHKDSFQITFRKVDFDEPTLSYNKIFDNYYTFTYSFKNDSERTIRNFNCTKVLTDNRQLQEGMLLYQSCDIDPGATLRCVYATKFNLAEQILNGTIHSLTFYYKMENVIGEVFQMKLDLQFVNLNKDCPDFIAEVSAITRLS